MFLTNHDIALHIDGDAHDNKVTRLLVSAEAELRSIGLVFEDEAEFTRTIQIGETPRSVFSITPARDISAIEACDSYNTIIQTYTTGEYDTFKHRNIQAYTTQVRLLNSEIYFGYRLLITAKWGIYVDFSDENNFEAKLIKSAVIDWINGMLTQYKAVDTTAQNVSRAKTGNSDVSFFSRKLEDYNWSLLSYPNFKTVLDWIYA